MIPAWGKNGSSRVGACAAALVAPETISSVTSPVTIFLTIERYTNPVTMSGQDAALVEALNGDATGRTLDLLRRLADTVASGRRLDATELAELNALLALVPVEVQVADGGLGHYVLEMHPVGGSSADRDAR